MFLLTLMVATLSLNAQGIYPSVIKYDKFDDEVSKRNVKTLISLNDDIITIETKGSTPVEYRYLGEEPFKTGSKQSPKELVGGVFGYEETYICVLTKNYDALLQENTSGMSWDELIKKYNLVEITFRTITTQYSHDFLEKIAWVKYKDGSRTIYR